MKEMIARARSLANVLALVRCENSKGRLTPKLTLIAPGCCVNCRAFWYVEMCALILERQV